MAGDVLPGGTVCHPAGGQRSVAALLLGGTGEPPSTGVFFNLRRPRSPPSRHRGRLFQIATSLSLGQEAASSAQSCWLVKLSNGGDVALDHVSFLSRYHAHTQILPTVVAVAT